MGIGTITTAQRLCAISALGDPTLREMADRVAVCKLLRENPSHVALRDRLLEFRASGMRAGAMPVAPSKLPLRHGQTRK